MQRSHLSSPYAQSPAGDTPVTQLPKSKRAARGAAFVTAAVAIVALLIASMSTERGQGNRPSGPISVHPSVEPAIIREVPVTLKHAPPAELDKYIPNPGMPRANRAISKENPHGSPNSPPNATVLQQHVLWWDFDGDGVIYPWDTYIGFRKLGFGYIISSIAPFFIHGSFSYPSSHSWIPNPLFPIHIDRMHRTKHGSDSEVYDTEGRFVPEKFEEIFSKYDRENKGGLSWRDIQEMVHGNMNIVDPTGWIAERLEWWVTYLLCKDERGIVTKEKIRGIYDGSIWEVIEKEVIAKKQAQRHKASSYISGMQETVQNIAQKVANKVA